MVADRPAGDIIVTGLGIDGNWVGIKDGDPRAVALFNRHYSARRGGDRIRYGMSGPGQTMTLLTIRCDALYIWLNNQVERYDGQVGLNCTIFRNEGPVLSSELILEAEELAWQRWPGIRLFTYVWDSKVESVNPGYCFKMAGWKTCGRNADGRLTILEKLPE
jgi:hypothetical protein